MSEDVSRLSGDSAVHRQYREQWRELLRAGVTLAALQAFYARYKYLIMSRHIGSYRAIGELLAGVENDPLPAVAERLHELMLHALAQPATRGGNANALLHICGYLKNRLQREEKIELLDTIEKYRCGEVEFDMPVALLREHFQRFPHSYIERQVFLQIPGLERLPSAPH